MPKYEISVTEVLHVPCIYTVEADTPEEALGMARIGDTVDERHVKMGEVADRCVHDTADDLEPIEEREDGPHPYVCGTKVRLNKPAFADDFNGVERTFSAGTVATVDKHGWYDGQGWTYHVVATAPDGVAVPLVYDEAEFDVELEVLDAG